MNPKEEPVTARMLFKGVMLTCINEQKIYEVGMIRCPLHEPEITIRTKTNGAVNSRTITWPNGHDLLFHVINPTAEGVGPYPGTGQDTDFDHIIDLEGGDLHREGVEVKTDLLQGRRLGVTAGKLYTHALSDVEFDLLTWTDADDEGTIVKDANGAVKRLGAVADQIGLNILCGEGDGGIKIIDLETGETVEGGALPALPGTTYRIEVLNDCSRDANEPEPPDEEPLPAPSVGTDFRFYYHFVESNDGVKYDLGFDVDDNAEPVPSPDACENTFLSQTKTLGLKT